MSNNQLKRHLLTETCSIALKWVKRGFVFRNRKVRHWKVDSSFLGTLFMSGKASAAIVRLILSEFLDISGSKSVAQVKLSCGSFHFSIERGIIENLALRWTRFLEVTDFLRSPEFLGFVKTLNNYNCIEKLRLEPNVHLSVDNNVAIVEACPNLSTMICPPNLFVALLQRVEGPAFSKLHTIEMTESVNNWSFFFENLNKHAKGCPVLETLTLPVEDDGLDVISKLAREYSIPTIKSYNVMTEPYCCAPIDFPLIASAFPMFPNLETASVTVDVRCRHTDRKTLPKVYKLFEKFQPNVEFTFNYNLKHGCPYSKTEAAKLEVQLRALGTITSIDRKFCRMDYSVVTSYPNKTLKLQLTIGID